MGTCRNGHDRSVLGLNSQGRCIACRRVSNSRAVAKYRPTPRGRETHRAADSRYFATAKGQLVKARSNLRVRIRLQDIAIAALEERLNAYS